MKRSARPAPPTEAETVIPIVEEEQAVAGRWEPDELEEPEEDAEEPRSGPT